MRETYFLFVQSENEEGAQEARTAEGFRICGIRNTVNYANICSERKKYKNDAHVKKGKATLFIKKKGARKEK